MPVAGAEMLVHVDDDSVRCPSAEVRYRLEDGGTTCVRIETIGGMIGATAQRYGWESVGDVSVDGEPGGWGFLETNLNARNGQSPPVFVLGRRPDQRHHATGAVTQTARPVRQPAEDRALYLRQLRATVSTTFLPELTSATAIDAAGLVDRILAEFIVEEEWAETLSSEFGAEFEALLADPADASSAAIGHPRAFRRAPPPGRRRRGAGRRERRRRGRGSCAGGSSTSSAASSSGSTSSVGPCLPKTPTRPDAVDVAQRVLGVDRAADRLPPPQAPGLARAGGDRPGSRPRRSLQGDHPGLAGRHDRAPAEVIVRKDRPVGVLQTRAAEEFAVLEAVHAHGGIPVPRPFFADEPDDRARLRAPCS